MSKPSSYAAPAVPWLLLLLLPTTVVAAPSPKSAAAAAASAVPFLVGIGKADVTGPAADVNMMGYALLEQTARGVHTRQHARAYLLAESAQQRFIMVVVDQAMVTQMLTVHVIRKLQEEYGDLYSADNVVLTASHTHGSVGGFMEYFLYHITSWGFVKQSFDALVDGIMEACRAAHADLRPSSLSWSEGQLLGANINRSPAAYAANPAAERALYTHDVDKEMTVLRIKAADGDRGRGMVTWFPVHPVSMNNSNRLLTSDNKGVAQQWVEKRWAPQQQDLEPGFTAAFAQSNTADTTPNILGTYCLDTGLPCDAVHSTCNGNNQLCVGRGPAWPADHFKSTEIIGERQADKAQELWSAPGHPISAPLEYRHVYVDITDVQVEATEFTRAGHTCPGAMGYSFAAGTTDGPGASGFFQGDHHNGDVRTRWSALAFLINGVSKGGVSPVQQQCQGAKPVLLNVGEASKPYPWVPKVTEVALLRLGNFVVVFVPGEFSTMAGRRLRRAVQSVLAPAWGPDTKVVLTSLTNTYSSYVTTFEEYQVQRYEGGSTLYGPYTLDAYIQISVNLAKALVAGQPVQSAVSPPDFEHRLLSLLPPVMWDSVPAPHKFGDVIKQPRSEPPYTPGEVVEAVFWSANPRNNLRRGGTFLEVQILDPSSGEWGVLYTDDDWSTKFKWDRPKGQLSSESTATVEWTVPAWTQAGTYKITVYGDAKVGLTGKLLKPFVGVTEPFTVAGSATAAAAAVAAVGHA